MRTMVLMTGALAMLASCTADAPSPARISTPDEPYYVREGMVNAVNPPTELIWNLQVEVMDDDGNFDPALMQPGHWQALEQGTTDLAAAAHDMADAAVYASHDPDGTLGAAPEGTDLAAIQARLEANPQAFRAFSQALAGHADQLQTAVAARDPARITQLVNDMQPVCKACHDTFWYPEEYAD